MGRESDAWLSYGDTSGAGRILLETTEIILRGAVRARISRDSISGYRQEGNDLVILTPDAMLRASLGATDVARWIAALAKPIPTLAAKLGVSKQTPVQVVGDVTDPSLLAALDGCISTSAKVLIAELSDDAGLDAAINHLQHSGLDVFWGVTVKGKPSPLREATLRERLRAFGFIDTKSCSVSESRSATRFQRR